MSHSPDDHHEHSPARSSGPWWKRSHKDWRVWLAVALMLLAMLAYVLSFDESLQPGGAVKPAVPAAP